MADIFQLHCEEHNDFELAIKEIEILVPKYLETVEEVKSSRSSDGIKLILKNLIKYWNRLRFLVDIVAVYETQMDFKTTIQQALQNELAVWEEIYFVLESDYVSKNDVNTLNTIDEVLKRMDTILKQTGFTEGDQDCELIASLLEKNRRLILDSLDEKLA